VILSICVVSAVWLIQTQSQIQKANAEAARLQAELEAIQVTNAVLRAEIEAAADPNVKQDIARKQLGYILPGETIYKEK
jgi:cell division protein FtsB